MNFSHITKFALILSCVAKIEAWLTPDSDETNGVIGSFDSDYFLITTGQSLLSKRDNIHDGVFAKVDILKYGIICEYRGPVIAEKDRLTYSTSNPMARILTTQGPDGLLYSIIGQNICSKINDCTSTLDTSYTQNCKGEGLEKTCNTNRCNGFSYNAKPLIKSESGMFILYSLFDGNMLIFIVDSYYLREIVYRR